MAQLSAGDLELEERLITFFELRGCLAEYSAVLKQCEVEEPEVGSSIIMLLPLLHLGKGECKQRAGNLARSNGCFQRVQDGGHHYPDGFLIFIHQIFFNSCFTFYSFQVVENKFQTGLTTNLTPWIDRLEKESFRVLDKPENFGHAQEIEKEAVVFAKEVAEHACCSCFSCPGSFCSKTCY